MFKTKKAAQEFFSNLLWKHPVNTKIIDEHEHMKWLINKHPEKEVKTAGGIDFFLIRQVYQSSRCFFLRRKDSTETDFSYRSCLYPKRKMTEFATAFRTAVMPDIISFRERHSACARCSFDVEMSSRHAHHEGISMSSIIREFISQEKIDVDTVKLNATKDGDIVTRFDDQSLSDKAVSFHRARAKIVLLCKSCHKKEHSCPTFPTN